MSHEQEHEAEFLKVGDEEANIDKGIYNLVKEIWLSGIETSNSCEDGDFGSLPERDVWLQFCMWSDFNNFMRISFTQLDPSECENFQIEIVEDAMRYVLSLMRDDYESGEGQVYATPLEIPHSISVRFPGRLQKTIEEAFVNYRTQKEKGDASQLLSMYDEEVSGKVLSEYFTSLLTLLYGDPSIKTSDVDHSYVLELFSEIKGKLRNLFINLITDPHTNKVIAEIPEIKKRLANVLQAKVDFVATHKNPSTFFRSVSEGSEAEQKRPKSDGRELDISGPSSSKYGSKSPG